MEPRRFSDKLFHFVIFCNLFLLVRFSVEGSRDSAAGTVLQGGRGSGRQDRREYYSGSAPCWPEQKLRKQGAHFCKICENSGGTCRAQRPV